MTKNQAVVFDIETDGLNPSVIHCLVVSFIDKNTGEELSRGKYVGDPYVKNAVNSILNDYDTFIGHNIIGFDIPVLEKLLDVSFSKKEIIDTFIISRLKDFSKFKGHSLDEWGEYLGCPKGGKPEDFSKYTFDMLMYCAQDVEVSRRVYQELLPFIQDTNNKKAIKLEQSVAYVLKDMEDRGFPFDLSKALDMKGDMVDDLYHLEQDFKDLPVKRVLEKSVKLRYKKDGSLFKSSLDAMCLKGAKIVGDNIEVWSDAEFNPNSHTHRIDLLNDAGWKPKDKSVGHIKAIREGKTNEKWKTYGWKVNEENLGTLPVSAPKAAKSLAQYLTLNARLNMLTQWIDSYSKGTGCVHSKVWGIGAWTQRCSHSDPNSANIPSVWPKGKVPESPVEEIKAKYDSVFRELFTARPREILVGVDAKSIQLRILAYYMKDPEFTKEVCSGDIHTANMKALGPVCKDRDTAKTFIYAWVLKAGIPKIAEILGCTMHEATKAKASFEKRWAKGLANVKAFEKDAEMKGYFVGLDGRKVYWPKGYPHKILSGVLQSGETIVMKKVLANYNRLRYHAFVHDEIQFSFSKFDDLKDMLEKAFEDFGKLLKQDLFGDFKYSPEIEFEVKTGNNWAETH